jgi:hypothetical protein
VVCGVYMGLQLEAACRCRAAVACDVHVQFIMVNVRVRSVCIVAGACSMFLLPCCCTGIGHSETLGGRAPAVQITQAPAG